MKNFIHVLLILVLAILTSCKEIKDVSPTQRETFIKIFEKGSNYSISTAEPVLDGFVIGGNSNLGLTYSSFISKCDLNGNIVWEIKIPSSSVSSIKVTDNGYLIFGNSIQANDTSRNINDQFITQALLTKMDLTGTIQASKKYFDKNSPTTDYNGLGINLDANGQIIISGTKKLGSLPSDAFVAGCSASTLDTLWFRPFSYTDREYITKKNIYPTPSGGVLWAASLQRIAQTQTRAYLTTSTIAPKASYTSSDWFGQQLTSNRLIMEEFQPTFGAYGVVGTFSDTQGKNGNVFFLKVDNGGKFDNSSIKTFDGETGIVNIASQADFDNAPQSISDDAGQSICQTLNGGFLLGNSMTTTLKRGKGGKDIWLVRLDSFGNVVWDKVFGGPGDEVVNSVRALSNGNFLVAGGSNYNGLTSAFIMIIDSKGEIVN